GELIGAGRIGVSREGGGELPFALLALERHLLTGLEDVERGHVAGGEVKEPVAAIRQRRPIHQRPEAVLDEVHARRITRTLEHLDEQLFRLVVVLADLESQGTGLFLLRIARALGLLLDLDPDDSRGPGESEWLKGRGRG